MPRRHEPERSRQARARRRPGRTAFIGVGAAIILVAVVAGGAWVTGDDGVATRQALHPDTRMGTVELRVRDLEVQRSFYGDALGLEVLEETDAMVRLGAAGEELVVLVRTDAPQPSPDEAGLYHTALLYPDASSLARVLDQVATSAPESFEGSSDHTVSEAFYFSDPEGNGVELYVDRPRSSWRWEGDRVQMGSAPLDPNAFLAEHAGEGGEGPPTVGHVHLRVGDLDDARRFYVGVLGFEITNEIDGAVFLAAGGYHHHVAANTWTSAGAGPRAAAAGLASFRVLLPSAAEVRALAERLRSAGYPHELTGDELTLADPWGNVVVVADAGAAGTAG